MESTSQDEELDMLKLDGSKMLRQDLELAAYMQRFNLDRETVEAMPAFAEHCKVAFRGELPD